MECIGNNAPFISSILRYVGKLSVMPREAAISVSMQKLQKLTEIYYFVYYLVFHL